MDYIAPFPSGFALNSEGNKRPTLKEASKEMETCSYKKTTNVIQKKSVLGDFQ